ncbi:MAG: ActS/PrrB/RegB family redox-sensitive histidine kinase [Pseudobdellovibrionaceae bacterium]|jgi:two-component system sensor histidine kinase RegB|nr:ActS/PrrB/RegB family redox-sensitive histidine kinase [Pseudobdellovibrionaceae bacterium]
MFKISFPGSRHKSSTAYDDRSVRGQSLIAARWIALTAQTLAVLISYYGLGFGFPITLCLLTIVASGIINNYATIKDHHRSMDATKSLAYLSFDILQLTILLYLTGGLGNPFFVLIIAPVLIGSTLLPKKQMLILLTMGLACVFYISLFYLPLEWPPIFIDKDKFFILVECLAMVITLIFASFYSWQISEESRTMQQAGFAADTALLKQKQLQALGGLAAAAVHELGSPLGTITIIAKELSHDLKDRDDLTDDIDTLITQTERCKTILANFGKTLKGDPTYMADPLPPKVLIQGIADGFLSERPEVRFTIHVSDEDDKILIPQRPELSHGLGVFIQNALSLATSHVSIFITINKGIKITIEDDGPGFPAKILPRLGEPYTSTRADSGKNMGLGVFIAQTLLEDIGANVFYNNLASGGAQVSVLWSEIAYKSLLTYNLKTK